MNARAPINGWELSPKVGRIFALIMLLQGPLVYLQGVLGIQGFVVYLSFSVASFCAGAFVLPSAKIWHRKTME